MILKSLGFQRMIKCLILFLKILIKIFSNFIYYYLLEYDKEPLFLVVRCTFVYYLYIVDVISIV